ncbi:MAG: MFS transporter [Desulfobacteraceae bacterium]|nr:MAG: MFS transporter [Desulfobacteraceae bacterium]
MMTSQVPWRIRIYYALPAFSLAVIGIPVYVYLPKFYTDTIGIDITTAGILLLLVRVFDAVTDPLIGYVSDNTRTRWGRRHPFIGLGAIGLAAAILMLFIPPQVPGSEQVFRFGFWLFALFFFWTLITIPYESLGPELTTDYHERTTLFSLRDGGLILGTLVAAASPDIAGFFLEQAGSDDLERSRFAAIAAVYAPMILITVILCIRNVPEKRTEDHIGSPRRGVRWRDDFKTIIQNRPFLILIAAYTISAIGSNLPATLILYYVQYVLESQRAGLFLFAYFLTGILCLPLWIGISRRTGKKRAWILSMLVNTGAFFGVFFLGPGDSSLYAVLVVISGIGFGAGLALPSSIQADVIDYDEWVTHQRREGRFIGLWSIAKKLAAALGVGVGLSMLGAAGYVPNQEQTEAVTFMLRTLYALVPCICNALSILIIVFYPIDSKLHEQIRQEIDAR